MKTVINKAFFCQDAVTLAEALLGKILVRRFADYEIKVRIVETEAYMGGTDQASHSYGFKQTNRVRPLYEIGGTTYVYLIYGMYHCFNIVAAHQGNPQAVLIRAGEIIAGQEHLLAHGAINHQSIIKLTNGPGKLCQALAINRQFNNCHLLTNDILSLTSDDYQVDPSEIVATTRINIDYADSDKAQPWRFYLKNSTAISKR